MIIYPSDNMLLPESCSPDNESYDTCLIFRAMNAVLITDLKAESDIREIKIGQMLNGFYKLGKEQFTIVIFNNDVSE